MLHISPWCRRAIAIVALAASSAFALGTHSVASPAQYPHDEPTEVEAENGDWPW